MCWHLDCSCSIPTMNCTSQPLFTGAHGVVPPAYEVLKEHEVAVLGVPQSQAPVTTTVINIGSETSVPNHIVWFLFNTIFMSWCCLGFVAFAYSVKVGGHLGCLQESVWEPGEVPAQTTRGVGSPVCVVLRVCVCVCVHMEVMMRLQRVRGDDQGQPFVPWWVRGQ